ncbi:MAG: DUF1573 domain-containing protein [Candidatus Krumholzibacteriia bacterium]
MRKRIGAVACLSAMVALAVMTAGVALGDEEGPVVLIEQTRHDFGEIFEQKMYKHAFTIKNIGTADLRIEKVQPG